MADIKNYIDQIKIGETTYDIATKRSIKFTNGGVETLWNGLSDITVAIPSISDLVQSPIVFAGTVGKGGINWSEGYSEPALKGYLLFVTETCTIDSGDSDSDFTTVTCEKGDMAIYDGSKWNIVSGENQVKIVGGIAGDIADGDKINVEIGSAKDVLVVEGKALTLSLDYADINSHVSKTEGDAETVDLTKVKVNEEYIKLSATDKSTTIGEEVELKNIKGIKDSTVSFTVTESEDGQLVKSVDFGTYTDGALPTFKMNESAVDLDVEGDSLTVVSSNDGDFVSSVALDDVTFIEDGEGKTAVNSITVVDSISESEGDDFLKGMHITVKGKEDVADEFLKKFKATGKIALKQFRYKDPYFPLPMSVRKVDMDFDGDTLDLKNFRLRVGRSAVNLTGEVNNVRRFLLRGRTLNGELNLKSRRIDINQLTNAYTVANSRVEENKILSADANMAMIENESLNNSINFIEYFIAW